MCAIMFGMHRTDRTTKPFTEDGLDEIEGAALVIVDNPDHYAHFTVEMAHRTLELIAKLRHGMADESPLAEAQAG